MKDKDIDALSADAAQDRPADDWADVKYSVREYIWYHANVTPQKAQDIADGIDRWYKKRAEAAASDWSRSNPLNLANRAVPEPPTPAATLSDLQRLAAPLDGVVITRTAWETLTNSPQPDTEALRLALEKALSEDEGTGTIAEEATRLAPKVRAALAASPPAAGQPMTLDELQNRVAATAGAAERQTGPDPTSRTQSDFRHDLLGEPYTAGAAERLDVERIAWDVWEYVIDSLQPQWKDARVAEEWGKALRAYIVAHLSEQADQ
jgi:hypothetical protein